MMKEGDVHKLWPGLHLHMRYDIQKMRVGLALIVRCSLLSEVSAYCHIYHGSQTLETVYLGSLCLYGPLQENGLPIVCVILLKKKISGTIL